MNITLQNFIEGCPPTPKVGFLKTCALATSDPSPQALQRLADDGFTHYERDDGILSAGPIYTFIAIPPLETRLREHVQAFFPSDKPSRRKP